MNQEGNVTLTLEMRHLKKHCVPYPNSTNYIKPILYKEITISIFSWMNLIQLLKFWELELRPYKVNDLGIPCFHEGVFKTGLQLVTTNAKQQ